MRRCLASIAQHELNALVQDTKDAIGSLKHQRESVMQAIEAARTANEGSGDLPDETNLLVADLLDKLLRLNAVLDQLMHETEQIEMACLASSTGQLITWTISLNLATDDHHRRSRVFASHAQVETTS